MPILRFTVLILLLIAPLITSQANFSTSCNNGDLYECSTSLCANYAWANGTCRINLTSTCQPRSTVYDGAECVQCAGLSQSNCTAFCPDYYYAPSTKLCTPCWVTFGPYCVGCTSTACTGCSYSSHLVVASNGSKCVIAQCSDRNCISCYNYTNQSRCQTCKTGYKVNALYGCSAVSCTIPYCRACQDATTCKSCVTDYVLSADKQHCYPSCPQAQCLSCCQPGVCQKCIYGYNLVNGTCVVDCSKSVVAHCATCHDLCTCTGCIPNYSLIFYGALCIPNCNDVNCEFCSAPDHCVACSVGYFLNQNGTCVQNTCPVQYCQICLNLQQCLQCQENYTLSVDNLTCIPTCALNITNCVYCFDAYTCAVCAAGYNLTNGTCSLVCNVSDCAVCATSTTCAICRANFTLSADKQTCSPVINIPNCVNGSGDGSCFRCKPGYTKVTYKGRDYCVILCGPGQINAGTIIAPICLVCGQEIENCQSCASNGNGSLICLSCAPGYFVDSAGYCSLCSEYNDNCWTCRGPNNCTACYAGYVLINGQCVSYQCDESVGNCLMCRAGNPYYCQTCLSGFTADGNGSCYVGCPPSYCFDARTQKCVCQHGTYDAKGKCNPCADSNCYTCTISGCLVCNQGYYLSGGTCQPCPPHCATCVSSDTCERCMDGFGLGLNYTCVSVGNGQCVGVSTTGQYFNCPPCCAQCTISSTGQIVCMEASPGCSIVGGTLITCDASCKTCSGTTNRSCTSCYPGQFLIGGECRNCSDPYATACLSTNRSFSTDCIPGYTATFCLGQVGGVCRPCAPNCIQCDAAGPGNCDKCQVGYVILVGTTNCTECAGGQPTCSPYNPVSLVNCVDGQYPNGQGGCSPCPTNCTTCESQTNCTDCIAGYALIDGVCYAIPAHCTGLNPDLTCSGCLSNYTLSADKKSCVYQQSCNATQSCAVCPTGFYLYKGCCYKCSLLTNCVQCGKTGCSKCANGYYLSNGQCLPCGSNCLICTSANVCVSAKPGHCVPTASTGKPSGVVIKCDKSCATCSSYKVCITCAKGYTRKGSECVKTKRASVKIVMKGNGKKNSIFKPKQSKLDTLFNGLSSINRIKNSICSNLPAIFKISSYSVCASILKIEYCATGSFIVGLWLPIDMYDNANDAKNAIGEAFQTGKPLDGAQIISSDVIIQGYEDTPVDPTTPANPTNWGLILGLSIPLATLLIVIVAIMVVRRKQQPVTAERTAGESCENLQKRGEQKL